LYKAPTFSAKVNVMSFLVSFRKWTASVVAASLALCDIGCGPEASTPSPAVGGKPPAAREQTGSTTGGPAKKGRAEVPEPAPAEETDKTPAAAQEEKPAEEKPANDKPDDKPADEKPNE
jgi:hypothetical protein